MGDAADRWRTELLDWAVPREIEAAAERSPWGHPPDRFALRADTALREPSGVSFDRAKQALTEPGSVLDVGAGVGAAGLPLLPYATSLTAVDPSERMLAMLAERAASGRAPARTVVGRWPEVAEDVRAHDLVVCHHVVYDVPDLAPFLVALTEHARRRVVVEVPPVHPQTWMAPLWLHFHGVVRPSRPTAVDLEEVVRETGVAELQVDHWVAPDPGHSVDIPLITRRLCLPAAREPEVAEVRATLPPPPRDAVTLSWHGGAGGVGRG